MMLIETEVHSGAVIVFDSAPGPVGSAALHGALFKKYYYYYSATERGSVHGRRRLWKAN